MGIQPSLARLVALALIPGKLLVNGVKPTQSKSDCSPDAERCVIDGYDVTADLSTLGLQNSSRLCENSLSIGPAERS